MRTKRRMRATAAGLVLSLALAACGSDGADETTESTEDAAAAAEDPSDENGDASEPVSLRFGHLYETSHPFHRCGAEPLAEELAAGDTGINIEVYPGGQLGGEQELVQSTESGDLDLSIAGPGAVANWHSPWGVLDAAYAVDDWEHMRTVYESDLGQELRDGMLDDANVRVLDLWLYGTRHVTSNSAVRSPDDLSGVRLRAIDTPVSLANASALGADPVPVAFDELYLALQQGVVDGQENPLPTIESLRFYEAQSHLNLTGHLVQSTVVMVAEPVWEQLSPDQQEALQAALETYGEDVRDCVEQEEQELLDQWEETGAFEEIVTEDEIDREAFAERASEVLPEQFAGDWGGDEMFDRVREMSTS